MQYSSSSSSSSLLPALEATTLAPTAVKSPPLRRVTKLRRDPVVTVAAFLSPSALPPQFFLQLQQERPRRPSLDLAQPPPRPEAVQPPSSLAGLPTSPEIPSTHAGVREETGREAEEGGQSWRRSLLDAGTTRARALSPQISKASAL